MKDGRIVWDGSQADAGDDLEALYLEQFGGDAGE